MLRKKCPSCGGYSYATSIAKLQQCAYCDHVQKITDVRVRQADAPKDDDND